MKLFVGNSAKHFGASISEKTGIPLGRWELIRFADSEIKPQIQDAVRGEDVIILSSTSNPVNDTYMELFLLADALRRSACGRIVLCMPYYGYARQNQQHLPGEPVSAQVVAKIIESVGVDELITIDLHEEQLTGFFSIPVTHLSALPLLAQTVGQSIAEKNTGKPVIVISPDQGGVERTRKFRDALANEFEGKLSVDQEIGIVEKLRNLEKTHETKFVEITGEVDGKIAIIPDDVIVSGGTIIHASEAALQKGVLEVYLAATHADFIDQTIVKLQNSSVEKVILTDTVAVKEPFTSNKFLTVSIAPLISKTLSSLGTP